MRSARHAESLRYVCMYGTMSRRMSILIMKDPASYIPSIEYYRVLNGYSIYISVAHPDLIVDSSSR